ncbi:hypothetical protein [Ostreiculturibacter nitratireducens]|uniref:hypothetical protein n=1 Tax=Ostreiculturibacter nitratireducens TaxID=3075226 RepID=UPI0031B5D41F
MSRHPVDHRDPPEGGRVEHYVDIERKSGEEGSHPASKEVSKRPVDRSKSRRTEEFVRIEKGRET